jgi:hypothetical protein
MTSAHQWTPLLIFNLSNPVSHLILQPLAELIANGDTVNKTQLLLQLTQLDHHSSLKTSATQSLSTKTLLIQFGKIASLLRPLLLALLHQVATGLTVKN